MFPDIYPRRRDESTNNDNDPSCSIVHRKAAKPIVIDGLQSYDILSIAVLVDGQHIVSGDSMGGVRRWRIQDGKQVGTVMNAGSTVLSIAASRDGKVIVSGAANGWVTVWNAESHSKVTKFEAHRKWVRAVDVSPDATRIATGSEDNTACVWSLSTGKRLLGPWKHNNNVVATKFSPDGRLIATATWDGNSVRVYDSQNGSLLADFLVHVHSLWNQSLAWATDSMQLFALSHDGYILRLDVSTGTTLSKWHIHSSNGLACIALESNGRFIAASAGSSVSFWDTTSQEQIGTVLTLTHDIWSVAMSSNYHFVTSGDGRTTVRELWSILPSHYLENTPQEIQHAEVEIVDDGPNERTTNLQKTIQELRNQFARSQQTHQEKDILIQSLCAQESSNIQIARLQQTVQELLDKLPESQPVASQETNDLNETLNSLRADLHTRGECLCCRFTRFKQTNQELRAQLADAQRKADGIDHAHEQMYRCESLYSRGCVQSAAECLLEFANTVPEDMRANKFILGWLADFTQRCVTTLERVGDEASNAGKQDEAVAAYSTALALDPSIPNTVLMKWAIIMLIRGSADEVSTAAIKFNVPRFIVYRVICDILEQDGRVLEAVEYFKQMQNELPEDAAVRNERAEQYTPLKARERWMHVFGFRRRASTKASRPTLCSLFRSICKAAKMTAVQQLFHNRSKLSHWLIGSDI